MGSRRSPVSTLTGRGSSRFATRVEDDSGAVLILALVFIIAIALIMLSLLSLTGNDIINASNLQSERSLDYAADGATTASMQAVRYSNTLGSSSAAQPCMPNGASSITVNGVQVTVDCARGRRPNPMCIKPNPSSLMCTTRVVDFFACGGAGSSCTATSQALVLSAQAAFDDYPSSPGSTDNCSVSTGTETCGIGMAVDSWSVRGANT